MIGLDILQVKKWYSDSNNFARIRIDSCNS